MSKTIDIPVQVPDWVTHIAQNLDGMWFAYGKKPVEDEDCFIPQVGGRQYFIANEDNINPNWRETLREVE